MKATWEAILSRYYPCDENGELCLPPPRPPVDFAKLKKADLVFRPRKQCIT